MARRGYTPQTVKVLFGKAQACACPECSQPLIMDDLGKVTVFAEIAHIRSEVSGGPRYDPSYQGDPNAPENLLLLCANHHKIVDANPSAYSVAVLEAWKETQVASAGQGTQLSDDQVRELIKLTPEVRNAVQQLIRLAYRLEDAARKASRVLSALEDNHRRAQENYAMEIVVYDVHDDGTKSLNLSRSLPYHLEQQYMNQRSDVYQQQYRMLDDLVSGIGEEAAVLCLADPLLGEIANRVVRAAEKMPSNLDKSEALEQDVELVDASVRELHAAAQRRS